MNKPMIARRSLLWFMIRQTSSYVSCLDANWPKDLLSLHDDLLLYHQLNILLTQEEMLGMALGSVLVATVNPWSCPTKRLRSRTFALLAASQATSQQSALIRKKSSAWSFTECQRKNIVTRLKSLWA